MNGEVFSWGNNEWGKLGTNSTENQTAAHQIESLKEAAEYGIRVINMSCGESHSQAILQSMNTNDQDITEMTQSLFVWGCGLSCQLGIDDINLDMVIIPHQQEVDPFSIAGQRNAYAKHNYSVVLTVTGVVYSWGSGEFGRLGYKAIKKQQRIPKKIDIPHKIVKLSLGMYHVGGLTYEGKIVTWGAGMSGQLGRGKVVNESGVELVENLENEESFVDVACGEKHTIVLSEKGDLYGFGCNRFGQLGIGSQYKGALKPKKIFSGISNNIQEIGKIVNIESGLYHNLCQTEYGIVIGFGCDQKGQLGRGSSSHQKNFVNYKNKQESATTKLAHEDLDQGLKHKSQTQQNAYNLDSIEANHHGNTIDMKDQRHKQISENQVEMNKESGAEGLVNQELAGGKGNLPNILDEDLINQSTAKITKPMQEIYNVDFESDSVGIRVDGIGENKDLNLTKKLDNQNNIQNDEDYGKQRRYIEDLEKKTVESSQNEDSYKQLSKEVLYFFEKVNTIVREDLFSSLAVNTKSSKNCDKSYVNIMAKIDNVTFFCIKKQEFCQVKVKLDKQSKQNNFVKVNMLEVCELHIKSTKEITNNLLKALTFNN